MAEDKEAKDNQEEAPKAEQKNNESSPILMYAVLGVLGILAIYGGFIMSKYILIPNSYINVTTAHIKIQIVHWSAKSWLIFIF